MRIRYWSSDVCSSDLQRPEDRISLAVLRHRTLSDAIRARQCGYAILVRHHRAGYRYSGARHQPEHESAQRSARATVDHRRSRGDIDEPRSTRDRDAERCRHEIERAHVRTPITNAHLQRRLLLEKKKK